MGMISVERGCNLYRIIPHRIEQQIPSTAMQCDCQLGCQPILSNIPSLWRVSPTQLQPILKTSPTASRWTESERTVMKRSIPSNSIYPLPHLLGTYAVQEHERKTHPLYPNICLPEPPMNHPLLSFLSELDHWNSAYGIGSFKIRTYSCLEINWKL